MAERGERGERKERKKKVLVCFMFFVLLPERGFKSSVTSQSTEVAGGSSTSGAVSSAREQRKSFTCTSMYTEVCICLCVCELGCVMW